MGDFWDDRSAARRLLGTMLVAVYLIALALAGLALVTRMARAEVYASFHDPEAFPSVRKALAANALPVYWGVGTRDPAGGGKKQSFDRMPANDKSVYSEIPGDHNSIMRDALPDMVTWVKGL